MKAGGDFDGIGGRVLYVRVPRCHCSVQCLGAMFGWRDGKSHDNFDKVQSLQVPVAVLVLFLVVVPVEVLLVIVPKLSVVLVSGGVGGGGGGSDGGGLGTGWRYSRKRSCIHCHKPSPN